MKRMAVTVALVAAVVLGAAGCTGDGGSDPSDEVSAPQAKPTKKESEKKGQQESDDLIHVGLNGTVTWDDDLTAEISDFKRGTSGPYAAPENEDLLRFKVTLDNSKGSENVDLSMTAVTCSTGEEIFDTDNGLDGSPQQSLLPGKKRSWETACAFSAKDKEVQIEVTPGTMSAAWYRAGVFTGKVK